MLDIKFIVENTDQVIERLNSRPGDYTLIVRETVELYKQYKEILVKNETAKAALNEKSKLIGQYKRDGIDISPFMEEINTYKEELANNNPEIIKKQIDNNLLVIPNIPHLDTPVGASEDDNVELSTHGNIRKFDFPIKAHYEITDELDFKRAASISKSRFVITSGIIAKLERALMNFMLDTHGNRGYTEFGLPVVVNSQTLYNSGQLPKFGDDLFKISRPTDESDEFLENERDFYLIPTAEVVLANIHANEILTYDVLPKKYMAFTQCFRKEAGSAGRDTRGLIRVHQFGKVELFKYVKGADADNELNAMVKDAAHILDLLKLPYRILSLCTGDISAGNAKTFDLEVWYPSQDKYRECSSCSTTGDYQGRRTGVRFTNEDGNKEIPHLLNGSGMATGRILGAIIENYQNEDGTISIPTALKRYFI